MEKSVQAAALQRQVAPPAFTDIRYRSLRNSKGNLIGHPSIICRLSAIMMMSMDNPWTSLHFRVFPDIGEQSGMLGGPASRLGNNARLEVFNAFIKQRERTLMTSLLDKKKVTSLFCRLGTCHAPLRHSAIASPLWREHWAAIATR